MFNSIQNAVSLFILAVLILDGITLVGLFSRTASSSGNTLA